MTGIMRHVERCYRPTPTSLTCVNLMPGNVTLSRTRLETLDRAGTAHAVYLGWWTLVNYNERGSPLYRRLMHDYYPNRAISLVTHSVPGRCWVGNGIWGRSDYRIPGTTQTPTFYSAHEMDLMAHEFQDGMRRLLAE